MQDLQILSSSLKERTILLLCVSLVFSLACLETCTIPQKNVISEKSG